MSDESDHENDLAIPIINNQMSEPEEDDPRTNSTCNPVDEDSQFIYDDELKKLICVGSTFDDIPQSIIDAFSLKTKVNKLIN
jgi:hypothetical protein